MLKISKLVKRYGNGDPVLKDLDLTVESESIVAIIGASGAGKSTLLRCINRHSPSGLPFVLMVV